MTRAVTGLVLVAFAILIGGVGIVAYKPFNVQAQAPTTIDTPAFYERPAIQSESNGPTTIDVPAVFPGELRAQDVTDIESRTIALFNAERQRNNRSLVSRNSFLTLAAQKYAQFLATCGCQMGHNADGSSPWSRIPQAGYIGSLGGEILAGGQTTPEQVVNDWIKSQGHHDIMLGAYGEVGVALVVQPGSQYSYYWVADWGGAPGQTTPGGEGVPGPLPPTPTPVVYQPIPTRPPFMPPTPTFPFYLFWTPTPRPSFPTPIPYFTVTPRPQQPTQTPIPGPVGQGWRVISDCNVTMTICQTTVYPK